MERKYTVQILQFEWEKTIISEIDDIVKSSIIPAHEDRKEKARIGILSKIEDQVCHLFKSWKRAILTSRHCQSARERIVSQNSPNMANKNRTVYLNMSAHDLNYKLCH